VSSTTDGDGTGYALLPEDLQPDERACESDLASRSEEEFLAIAQRAQRQRAQLAPRHAPGTCVNCDSKCLPRAVYCDEDCRADHEDRLSAERRGGK
jgi:hypothetical protein